MYIKISFNNFQKSRVTTFFNEISRDMLTIFFLFLAIDKTSDFDILIDSWAQWVGKMIKVSSQSDLV